MHSQNEYGSYGTNYSQRKCMPCVHVENAHILHTEF